MIWWRMGLVLVLVYAAIRLGIPALAAVDVPFEVRAALLSLLLVLGFKVAPWVVRKPSTQSE